jgi:hypothetical protein
MAFRSIKRGCLRGPPIGETIDMSWSKSRNFGTKLCVKSRRNIDVTKLIEHIDFVELSIFFAPVWLMNGCHQSMTIICA